MRYALSIVPPDHLDPGIYLLLEDFGARASCPWREADAADTDQQTAIQDMTSGQTYPVVAFNAAEGWCRGATSDIADEFPQRGGFHQSQCEPPVRDSARAPAPGSGLEARNNAAS